MSDEPYNVVSFSGGKDSTAMLLMMLEKNMQVDEILFFDTGWEFPQMYEHIAKVEKLIKRKVTRLHPREPFGYMLTDKPKKDGTRGFGFARPNARWCTAYKTQTIDKQVKGKHATRFIGIAADETKRIREKCYPLVDWGITEADALAYCYSLGFDWGGLYDGYKRLSCWCCPLQSLKELKYLRANFPRLWKELKIMEDCQSKTFRIDYSVEQLERRFANEDKQMALEI